ncbi:MAG: TraB/GumN family protein [Sphingomonadaceae bacterium]
MFLIRFLLLLLLPVAALAAPKTAPAPTTPAVTGPAMWEIKTDTAKVTLFGTVHTLPRDVDWFRPHVVAAVDSADLVVLETLPPDSYMAVAPMIERLARLPQPHALLLRLPAAQRGPLVEALARLKPPPLERYETWYVALTLANMQAAEYGFDPRIGAEAVLAARARIRQKPLHGLETMEEQLINFDALPESDQVQLLLTTLDDLSGSKQRMEYMVKAWVDGDIDWLARQMNRAFSGSPMLKRMLMDDRNERWAAWIARKIQTEPQHLFVAVGAGHLGGAGNLIEILGRYGLEAKLVTPPVGATGARRQARQNVSKK